MDDELTRKEDSLKTRGKDRLLRERQRSALTRLYTDGLQEPWRYVHCKELVSLVGPEPPSEIALTALRNINPFGMIGCDITLGVIGSPGSGKTEFLKRVGKEVGGNFFQESGVWRFYLQQVIIYLVDPLIKPEFDREDRENMALANCHLHLGDALYYEQEGVPVYWFLSKTAPTELEENRAEALEAYSSCQSLAKTAERVPALQGFDSVYCDREELFSAVGTRFKGDNVQEQKTLRELLL